MYMDTCATPISSGTPQPSTTSHGSNPNPNPTSTGTPNTVVVQRYDVSTTHKILAPLSVALVLPLVLVSRISSPSLKLPLEPPPSSSSPFIPFVSAFVIFGIGIAGLVTSFTSISYDPSLVKRAESSLHLQTGHGIVGVALAAAFYVAVPVVFLLILFMRHRSDERYSLPRDGAEKSAARSPAPSTLMLDGPLDHHPSLGHSRSQSSTGLLQFWKRSMERSRSSDTEADEFGVADSPSPPRPSRGFEVVNRQRHTHRGSSHSMSGLVDHGPGGAGTHVPTRLGDISWLNRRRMVNSMVCTCSS